MAQGCRAREILAQGIALKDIAPVVVPSEMLFCFTLLHGFAARNEIYPQNRKLRI